MNRIFIFCIFMQSGCTLVSSHGRLNKPPARNTAWRHGLSDKKDYNDMENNCGGRSHQGSLGGKCGLCGDPYDGTQDNMAGGKYASFTRRIVGCYKANSIIDVEVEITAPHRGYFEFRLCENNDLTRQITQECLDKHLLTIENTPYTENTKYYGRNNLTESGIYNIKLTVPKDITCIQCVLQWKWTTGNSPGLKQQEEFYGCADISIKDDCSEGISPSNAPGTKGPVIPLPTTQQNPATNSPAPQTQTPPIQKLVTNAPPGSTSDCKATEVYKNNPGMDEWCENNCPYNCPGTHCICGPSKRISTLNQQKRLACEPNVETFKDSNSDKWEEVKEWCMKACTEENGDGCCPELFCNDGCRTIMALRELSFLIN